MPYIEQDRRRDISPRDENGFTWLEFDEVSTTGEMNFFITKALLAYLPEEPCYADYNEVIGILESVKLEFFRRAVAPYEDQKIAINGDVYP
jgi:hypothetical protein